MGPSSEPTIKLFTSPGRNPMEVTATWRVCLHCNSRVSCGVFMLSRVQEHNLPSLLILIRLWAFCEPTTCMQCMGWVWDAADREDRWTGVRLLLRLSHMTIWPEYVPAITRLGWKLAKQQEVTQLEQLKMYSGVLDLNLEFQTRATPSGSRDESS